MITDSDTVVEIDDIALSKILEIMKQYEEETLVLRLYVQGGGCSGYQMGMALDKNVDEKDHVFEIQNIRVAIDELSFPLVKGAKISYEGGEDEGFVIQNPVLEELNASSACSTSGCSSCGPSGCY